MVDLNTRFRNAWNAFLGRSPTKNYSPYYGNSSRPDRISLSRNNARTVVNSIYNRIAVDVSLLDFNHVRLDENGNYKETIKSSLNDVLTLDANLDQTGRGLIIDAVMSMFDEGCVGIVPVFTDVDPEFTDSYNIYSLRIGKILEWYPGEVKIRIYNEETGKKEDIKLSKRFVAIIENPFYSIMNEPNSTLQRLVRVLNHLDRTNEQNSAGKMDLIVQLPYVIKSKAREIQAEERRRELENQLTGSQYGIAYIDGTERVIQLNRSVENNLWDQAKDLIVDLYNQLGLTQSIFDGTADEKTLLNYYDRTIKPIALLITEEMQRKWLSKTARTQGQAIRYFRDPFNMVPISQIAEMSDTLTRNEIATSNEMRSKIGFKPIDDPKADQLRNSNLNHPDETEETEKIDLSKIENLSID